MKCAIVDLGSNTIRMSVYRILPGGGYELLFSKKEMAGLVNDISDGILSEAGIQRASTILLRFLELLKLLRIGEMYVFATASLRNIRNTEQAVAQIREKTGLNVEVLSGELEAELGYYGALQTFDLRDGALFDIGGGSTEIVEVRDGQILSAQSLPIGSLNLFHSCVSKIWPKQKEQDAMEALIKDTLSGVKLPVAENRSVCGVGGTARAVLKMANAWYGHSGGDRTLTPKELHGLNKALQKQDPKVRRLVLNSCPDRVHTILPGVMLMDLLCQRLGAGALYISRSGVREGYLYYKLLRKEK